MTTPPRPLTIALTRAQIITCLFWNSAHTAAHAHNQTPDPAAVKDRAGDTLTLQHKLALMAWIVLGGRPLNALKDVAHRNRSDVPAYRQHLDRHVSADGTTRLMGVHSMLGAYRLDRPIQVMSWKEKRDDTRDGLNDLIEYAAGETCVYTLFSVREREAVLNIKATGIVPESITVQFHGWISSEQLLRQTRGVVTRYNNGTRCVLEATIDRSFDTLLDFFYGDERPHGLPPPTPPLALPPPTPLPPSVMIAAQSSQPTPMQSENNSQEENSTSSTTSTKKRTNNTGAAVAAAVAAGLTNEVTEQVAKKACKREEEKK